MRRSIMEPGRHSVRTRSVRWLTLATAALAAWTAAAAKRRSPGL